MGNLLSFLRREIPFEIVLQEIDDQILAIEERSLTYRANWRKWISNLLILTLVVEALYFLYFYIYGLGMEPGMRLLVGFPLILIPFIGWLLKNAINWYYQYRVTNDEHQLNALKAKQRGKIEEFARLTDYYKTRSIMDKYLKTLETPTPDKRSNSNLTRRPNTSRPTTPRDPTTPRGPVTPGGPITPRHTTPRNPMTPQTPMAPNTPMTPMTRPPIISPMTPQTSMTPTTPMARPTPPIQRYGMPVPRELQTPRIVRPQRKGPDTRPWYDVFIDYLVGDSSEDSVVLMCESCGQHNGLAAVGEMEDIQFRCISCQHLNLRGKKANEEPKAPPRETLTSETNEKEHEEEQEEEGEVEEEREVEEEEKEKESKKEI